MLAAKFFDDYFYNNAFYAKLGGVASIEMNSLELEFLQLLNSSLFVSPEVYFKYHAELRNYVGIEEYDRAQVRVDSSDNLASTEALLIEEGYRVTALSKTVEQASKIFQGIQAVLATFGGIALVVSAIGMFNTMTVTLLERTKEIGIMRTLGASPNDVKYLFVSESVVVGFLGGVSGIVMGVSFGLAINLFLNLVAGQFGGQSVSLFSFPLDFLTFIAVFSGAVGYLTGIFPAKRAAKLNPLDAIRYE